MAEVDPAVEDRDREARAGRLHSIGADRAQVVAQIGGRERVGEADERVAASRRLGVAEDAAALELGNEPGRRSAGEAPDPQLARDEPAPAGAHELRRASVVRQRDERILGRCQLRERPAGRYRRRECSGRCVRRGRAEPDGERSGEREHLHGRHGSRRQ